MPQFIDYYHDWQDTIMKGCPHKIQGRRGWSFCNKAGLPCTITHCPDYPKREEVRKIVTII